VVDVPNPRFVCLAADLTAKFGKKKKKKKGLDD
jgi:hypothetical protein